MLNGIGILFPRPQTKGRRERRQKVGRGGVYLCRNAGRESASSADSWGPCRGRGRPFKLSQQRSRSRQRGIQVPEFGGALGPVFYSRCRPLPVVLGKASRACAAYAGRVGLERSYGEGNTCRNGPWKQSLTCIARRASHGVPTKFIYLRARKAQEGGKAELGSRYFRARTWKQKLPKLN